MSTDPLRDMPPPDQTPAPAAGLPAFFPASACPLPSRFWKVALQLDQWSPAELAHLAGCPQCQSVQKRVAAAAQGSRGPVIGSAVHLPVPVELPPPRPAPPPPTRPATAGWFQGSWLGQGLRLLASFCARLVAPRAGACQRQSHRHRLGMDRLEDRDVLNGFFPWNAGWQPAIMAADPGACSRPVVVAAAGIGAAIAVPGTPGQDERAWLGAIASLVWSGAAPETGGTPGLSAFGAG